MRRSAKVSQSKPAKPTRTAAEQAATRARKSAALVKARAARAAKRAATGKQVNGKPIPTAGSASTAAPVTTRMVQPFHLNDDWRIDASSDARNWLLQTRRGGDVASEDDESEDVGESGDGATSTWATAGFYSTVEAACRGWAQRYSRGLLAGTYEAPAGAPVTTLPEVLALVLTRLEHALDDIGKATGRL